MLFGRVDNLFLTGRQRPSTSIQPCPMGDGWLYASESNWSSFTIMIKGVIIRTQSQRWFLFHAFPFNWPWFSTSFAFVVLIYRLYLFCHRLSSLEDVIAYWSYHKSNAFYGHETHGWNHTQSSYRIHYDFGQIWLHEIKWPILVNESGTVSSWIL